MDTTPRPTVKCAVVLPQFRSAFPKDSVRIGWKDTFYAAILVYTPQTQRTVTPPVVPTPCDWLST